MLYLQPPKCYTYKKLFTQQWWLESKFVRGTLQVIQLSSCRNRIHRIHRLVQVQKTQSTKSIFKIFRRAISILYLGKASTVMWDRRKSFSFSNVPVYSYLSSHSHTHTRANREMVWRRQFFPPVQRLRHCMSWDYSTWQNCPSTFIITRLHSLPVSSALLAFLQRCFQRPGSMAGQVQRANICSQPNR